MCQNISLQFKPPENLLLFNSMSGLSQCAYSVGCHELIPRLVTVYFWGSLGTVPVVLIVGEILVNFYNSPVDYRMVFLAFSCVLNDFDDDFVGNS